MGFKSSFKVPVPKVLKSVKYTLAAVNSVFLLTGLLLLLVGVSVQVIYSQYDGLITKRFFTLPGFVIATGVIILLGSVLGYYAAYSKQFYFIAAYAMLMIVILVFELSMVIVTFNLSNDAASDIRPVMLESLNQYESRREIAEIWDDLQTSFKCCGVAGRFDWLTNRIPISCCFIDYGTISPFVCTSDIAYNIGCAEALGEWLSYNAYVIAVSSLVATCLQVPITLTAGWMAWRAKYEEIELES